MSKHKHKKFNRYTSPTARRRKGLSPYLIIPIAGLLALVMALALGNCLGKKAEGPEKPPETAESDPPQANAPTLTPATVNGYFATLEHITDNTQQNVMVQFPEDAVAVSLELFSPGGMPYYNSSAAAANGKPCGELTLKRVFDAVGERYASVLFPSSALKNTDEGAQAVLNAYEVSLISEIYAAGADDIIILIDGISLDEEFISRLSDYVYALRRPCPELCIGLALSPEVLTDKSNSSLIEAASKETDLLALDLTKCADTDELRLILNEGSINILRREMRLLLKSANDKDLLALTELLDKYKMTNWQVADK